MCGGCIYVIKKNKKKLRAENTALAASKDTEESGERWMKRREAEEKKKKKKTKTKRRRRWSGSPLSGPPAARGPRQPFTKNCNWKYFSSFFPEIIYESSTGQLARASRLPLFVSLSLSLALSRSIYLRLRTSGGQGRNRGVRETRREKEGII